MLDVINLAAPFFGLIFLGLFCGKLKQIPDTGLAWMNFFLIYVSLPCLFYRVLAQTPLERLNNPPFIVATMLTTATMFALAFLIGWLFRRHTGGRRRSRACRAPMAISAIWGRGSRWRRSGRPRTCRSR